MENIINLIRAERERQNNKWGEQNHDDYRWLAILAEEVGEAAQAILHDEFGGSHAGTAKAELVHVAAVAVQWLECMERRQLTSRAADVLVRCKKCNALIETTVHCDVCGTFEPTRR